MSIAFVREIGTPVQTKSSVSSLAFVVGVDGVAVNEQVFLAVSTNNIALNSSSGDRSDGTNQHHKIVDLKGNTWVKVREQVSGGNFGFADAGSCTSIWMSHIRTALVSGDELVVHFVRSVAGSVMAAASFSVAASKTLEIVQLCSGTGSSTTPGNATTGIGTYFDLDAVEHLRFWVQSVKGVIGDTFTIDASPAQTAATTRTATSGGADGSNVCLVCGYQIVTSGSTDNIGNTITSRTWGFLIMSLIEVDDDPPVVTGGGGTLVGPAGGSLVRAA